MTDDMPEMIWAYDADAYENHRGWTKAGERMDGTPYTRTSTIAAKLEAADKMEEALELLLFKKSSNFRLKAPDYMVDNLDQALSNWKSVNGEKG